MIGSIPTETDAEKERVARLQQMTPEKIAPLVVYLGSDKAAGISGQIFSVRNNEIFLFNQTRPIRAIHRADGWTPDKLDAQLKGAFGAVVHAARPLRRCVLLGPDLSAVPSCRARPRPSRCSGSLTPRCWIAAFPAMDGGGAGRMIAMAIDYDKLLALKIPDAEHSLHRQGHDALRARRRPRPRSARSRSSSISSMRRTSRRCRPSPPCSAIPASGCAISTPASTG